MTLEDDPWVQAATNFYHWRRRVRSSALRLIDVLHGNLDINWSTFAKTRGAFVQKNIFDLFSWHIHPPKTEDWSPWANYFRPPPSTRIADLLPTFKAGRGGIVFATPLPVEERLSNG